jgi:tRNA(Arg) A34 adenosine deaminase TadA
VSDLAHLKKAIQVAEENSATVMGGPFGAVVVSGDTVVGTGGNRVVLDQDPTAHAEILAIREAARELGTHVLDRCVIYCSCEPCPMCLAAIYWARIPRVVYAASASDAATGGFDDGFISKETKLTWAERSLESKQALREEGAAVLRSWKENPHRMEY